MKQFFKDNGGLLLLAAALLAGVIALSSYIFGFDPLSGVLEVLATPVRAISSWAAEWAQRQYDRTFQYEKMAAEIDELRRQLAEMEQAAREGEDAVRENERLKDLLGLAEERPDLTYRDAEVTRRSTSNWESNLMIDRGTADGVAVDNCVIDQYGNLVGVVTEAGLNWAEVTTILDTSTQMGGRVARTDENAILQGDFTLMLEGLLKLSFLPEETKLAAGDQVTTSGLGGVYPKGILVGSVQDLATEADGVNRCAEVKPAADIAGIRYVYVITDYDGGSE